MNPHHQNNSNKAEQLSASLIELDKSMEDIKEGKTRPAKEAILQIANEIGVEIDRQIGDKKK